MCGIFSLQDCLSPRGRSSYFIYCIMFRLLSVVADLAVVALRVFVKVMHRFSRDSVRGEAQMAR